MLGKLIKSKLGFAAGICFLLVTIFFLVQETYKKYVINNEIRKLREEIALVEGKNKEILELINYYKTTEYKERQARSILGLAKPGEFVVALPPKENDTAMDGETVESASNLQRWWDYFFSK